LLPGAPASRTLPPPCSPGSRHPTPLSLQSGFRDSNSAAPPVTPQSKPVCLVSTLAGLTQQSTSRPFMAPFVYCRDISSSASTLNPKPHPQLCLHQIFSPSSSLASFLSRPPARLRVLCFANAGNAEDMYTNEGTGSRRAPSPLLASSLGSSCLYMLSTHLGPKSLQLP
jgi:hypothetical protein